MLALILKAKGCRCCKKLRARIKAESPRSEGHKISKSISEDFKPARSRLKLENKLLKKSYSIYDSFYLFENKT